MNITYTDRIAHTIARAEARLIENKSGLRTYKSEKFAASVAGKVSQNLADYWEVENAPVEVLQLANGRYFIAVDLNAIVTKSKCGGFLGAHLDDHWTISTDIQAANSMAA